MSSDKKNVLIVDDSMEQIDFLTEVLLENYNVISAFNGSKALELARNTPAPDLILLDIIIPAPGRLRSLLSSKIRSQNKTHSYIAHYRLKQKNAAKKKAFSSEPKIA